jgi:hypothetical protein
MKADDRHDESSWLPDDELTSGEVPSGIDRRTFMMRSAVIGTAGVTTGCTMDSKYKEASEGALAVSVVLC